MESQNEAAKLVAQALEELKPLRDYAWGDDDPASIEIDPIILLLQEALDKLTNKM